MSTLGDFRVDGEAPVPRSIEVERPPLRRAGFALCLDQTISRIGWASIMFSEGIPTVVQTGTIDTEATGIKGYEDYLKRVEVIACELDVLVSELEPKWIVHEAPPMGGRLARPESSLTCAAVVRTIGVLRNIEVRQVHAKQAKKLLTGNGNAEKKTVREALFRFWPHMARQKPMNLDISDAIAVGITDAAGVN